AIWLSPLHEQGDPAQGQPIESHFPPMDAERRWFHGKLHYEFEHARCASVRLALLDRAIPAKPLGAVGFVTDNLQAAWLGHVEADVGKEDRPHRSVSWNNDPVKDANQVMLAVISAVCPVAEQ